MGSPDAYVFRTKPQIAPMQIRRARERRLPEGVVLAEEGYGKDTRLSSELTGMELPYVAGSVMSTVTVW